MISDLSTGFSTSTSTSIPATEPPGDNAAGDVSSSAGEDVAAFVTSASKEADESGTLPRGDKNRNLDLKLEVRSARGDGGNGYSFASGLLISVPLVLVVSAAEKNRFRSNSSSDCALA